MLRSRHLIVCFGIAAVCFALGCAKEDGRGGSPNLQPVAAAQEQPKPVAVKEQPKEAAKPAAVGDFAFPTDEGGKILGRILPPKPPASLGPLPTKEPSERKLPAFLSNPDLATVPPTLAPLPYPQPPRAIVRPTAMPDRVPADLAQHDLDRPETIVLPVGALTKIDRLDLSKPAELPILARPTADRASLDDPTAEFTARSVINSNLPLRVGLSMFVRVNLPEPFENAAAAKVKTTLPDDPNSALGNPPPPKP